MAVLVGAVSWGLYWQKAHPVRKAAPAPSVSSKPLARELSLAGKIQARNVVDVAAPIDGTLDQYLVNVGEDVFEGEVLARIKNSALDAAQQDARALAERAQGRVTDLEAQLIAARLELSRAHSDLTRAQSEYERTQKAYARQQMLLDAGATPRLTFEKSERDYQNAKSDYEGFQGTEKAAQDRVDTLAKEIGEAKAAVTTKSADLDTAEAQISGGEVRSPVNGTVVARRGQAGDPVDPGMKDLLRIAVDLSALSAVVSADPATEAQIHPGQAAAIEIAEAPSMIDGTVRDVRSGQVIVDFTSPTPVIKPGMTVQVKFTLGTQIQGK